MGRIIRRTSMVKDTQGKRIKLRLLRFDMRYAILDMVIQAMVFNPAAELG